MSATMPEKKICVVGYKKKLMPDGVRVYGYGFDKIIGCCEEFESIFTRSQAQKTPFDDLLQTHEGLHLVKRGKYLRVVLSIRNHEYNVKHCPFCGCKVEIKETKRVQLKKRTRTVPDGYDEIEMPIPLNPGAEVWLR